MASDAQSTHSSGELPAMHSSGRGQMIASAGTLVSAVVASSCCWMPLLLLAVGVSGVGIASAIEAYRPFLIVVTFAFLGAAFYMTYRPRRATAQADCCAPAATATDCCAPNAASTESCCATSSPKVTSRWNLMALNKGMLWVVTVLAVAFLFFPSYVVALIGPGGDAITADMQRSVITLDGMTCEACAITATTAIKQAPGVLAVQVDYPTRQAAVGTRLGEPVPREQILASLEKVGYRGQFVDD